MGVASGQYITIAQVIARLNVGGAAVQVILLTEALRQRGYRTLLLSGKVSPGEAGMEYLAEQHGLEPITISGLSRGPSCWDDLRALWRLIQIFRREKPLLVHTHTAKAGTLGRIAALVTGVPLRVHTFHGHVFDGYFSRPVQQAILAAERLLARGTDCIVAVSESQKRELADVYRVAAADKIVAIPVALDLDAYLPIRQPHGGFRKTLNCAPQDLLVGWIGRFTGIKAPELLVDCAALVGAASRRSRFVMVGDGELRQPCEEKIRRAGLETLVTITGWQRQLSAIYADLDIVVLTSRNEGTPVTLLEAMASERPFVATDAGGVRDLMVGKPKCVDGLQVFENGILVKRGDAPLLAKAIGHLAAQPGLRSTMGCAGREFVKRFSPRRLADDLEHLYRTLAEAKQAGRAHSRSLGDILASRASKTTH
jgi:glycosyltransferase involved in cell wall biosynthesis